MSVITVYKYNAYLDALSHDRVVVLGHTWFQDNETQGNFTFNRVLDGNYSTFGDIGVSRKGFFDAASGESVARDFDDVVHSWQYVQITIGVNHARITAQR